ncbi:uncharacterized protein LOC132728697 isoform X2 [Ruditapes philippinarum]|uniref:uncharacterized protein LOC132728697 isoform X2 n=1 Tax=Ruditapes philippinarum TaxID=129788 RepID=UPI00295C241D|nr:uncharacterized protein LOC132728697 isoform X2 [Ruditapes philippinarum]
MAAVLGRTEIGIKKTGTSVSVANDPRAKLMYYLDCICCALDLSDTDNLTSLRNYRQYYSLTEAETDALITLCFLLSPDELSGKVIFQDDTMCGDSSNEFYEISAVRNNLVISDSIIIGGQRRAVSEIMAFKQQWLINNWVNPMKHFAPRLARITGAARAVTGSSPPRRAIAYRTSSESIDRSDNSNSDDCCCVIL